MYRSAKREHFYRPRRGRRKSGLAPRQRRAKICFAPLARRENLKIALSGDAKPSQIRIFFFARRSAARHNAHTAQHACAGWYLLAPILRGTSTGRLDYEHGTDE